MAASFIPATLMHPTSLWPRTRSYSVPASADDTQAVAHQTSATPLSSSPIASLRSASNIDAASATQYSLPRSIRGYFHFSASFLRAQRQCSGMAEADAKFLPKLIESEIAREPSMRLSHHDSPQALVDYTVQRCRLPEAEGREQGIVGMGRDGIHFAAFDLAIRAGQPSLILVEPGSMSSEGGSRLAFRLCQSLARLAPHGQAFPKRCLMIFETQMQQSNVDCGMFSLVTSKTMFEEASTFNSLHTRLRAGEFDQAMVFHHFPFDKSDELLPPSIMRHTQSSHRLHQYALLHVRTNKGAIAAMPALLGHQRALTFARDDRSYSVSIELERIRAAGRALPPPLESLNDTFLQDLREDAYAAPDVRRLP